MFCSRAGSTRQTLEALSKFVLPALTYTVGVLNFTQRHLQRFRAVQQRMERKVLGAKFTIPKYDLDGPDGGRPGGGSSVQHSSSAQIGLQTWYKVVLSCVFDFAGHLARFGRHQPSRLAWKAFHWRGIKYLRTLEALTGSQCHGRSFKVWRYEFQFTSILGDDWQNLALDSDQWQEGAQKRLIE